MLATSCAAASLHNSLRSRHSSPQGGPGVCSLCLEKKSNKPRNESKVTQPGFFGGMTSKSKVVGINWRAVGMLQIYCWELPYNQVAMDETLKSEEYDGDSYGCFQK